MSRVWRTHGNLKEGISFFKSSRRNPEGRGVDQTAVTYCAAQTIPSEILHAILSHIPQDALAATLASCTLVCRSWTVQSSALLLRRSVIRCTLHRIPRFDLFLCGYILCIYKWKPVGVRPREFCGAALQSHRITFNLQDLEIAGCYLNRCLDFMSLKEVVFRVHNLRSFKLGPLRFKPLSSRHRSSLGPRSAQDRRSLDALVLRGDCCRESTPSTQPAVWDVLLWFDSIGCLDISEGSPYGQTMALSKDSEFAGIKARVHVGRLVMDQNGCVTALDVLSPKPLTAPGVNLPKPYYVDLQGRMDLLDFSCLTSLQVLHLTESHFDHFNAFLQRYGSKIVECTFIIHPPHFPSPVPKCISFALAPLRKCTFTYQISIPSYSSDYTHLSLMWNHLLKAFVANTSLEELSIGFRLLFYVGQPDVDRYLPFLAALDWSPLDRLTEETPQLNVQVAFWFQIISRPRLQLWRAVTSQFRDLIAPALPSSTRTIISFAPDD